MSEAKTPRFATMPLAAMEAAPENQPGSAIGDFFFNYVLNYLDSKYPGAKALLLKAAEVLPLSKIWHIIEHARENYQAGQDFVAILTHALEDFVTITPAADDQPIRMSAKAPPA